MKKIIFSIIGVIGFTLFSSAIVFANTAREEAEGKVVWEKIQAKQVVCSDLSNDDFGALGEYFMGQMAGASHKDMNAMMEQMMGKEGEEQMHAAMGKRLSGCDSSAAFPAQSTGFMPMMQMMMGGGGNSMMNFGFARFGGFGWIFAILWWLLIIAGVAALIKLLAGQSRRARDYEKSPLEILKERYAKGEIDKKEFDDKKKELG